MRLAGLLVAAVLAVAPARAAAEPHKDGGKKDSGGKIEHARQNMHRDERGTVRDHRRGSTSDDDDGCDFDCDDDDDDDGDSLGGLLTLYVITVPFWAPSGMMGDWPTLPSGRRYAYLDYPYAGGAPGRYRFIPRDEHGAPLEDNPWEMQVDVLASYERHSSTFDGQRLAAHLTSNRRIGFDAALTRYDETLAGGGTDHLWQYQLAMSYAFAVAEHATMSAAMGLRGARFAAGDHRLGFLFRYGFEVWPVRPLHLWAVGELGNVSDSFAGELEGGVGAVLQRFELFAGYRAFRLAGVTFSGPELGLIVWM